MTSRHVGFWRTHILDVAVERPQRRRYTDRTISGPTIARPQVRFLLGDESGARSQLSLPFNRRQASFPKCTFPTISAQTFRSFGETCFACVINLRHCLKQQQSCSQQLHIMGAWFSGTCIALKACCIRGLKSICQLSRPSTPSRLLSSSTLLVRVNSSNLIGMT